MYSNDIGTVMWGSFPQPAKLWPRLRKMFLINALQNW